MTCEPKTPPPILSQCEKRAVCEAAHRCIFEADTSGIDDLPTESAKAAHYLISLLDAGVRTGMRGVGFSKADIDSVLDSLLMRRWDEWEQLPADVLLDEVKRALAVQWCDETSHQQISDSVARAGDLLRDLSKLAGQEKLDPVQRSRWLALKAVAEEENAFT